MLLLTRLLIYASVIVVSSVRYIPFNLNLNSRPKTLEAFNFNSQIETIYFLIIIIDPIDTSIILFIFDQEMFHLKATNYWLPRNTYYVSCVHTFIKITSFICLLICLSYLSPTWITFTRIIPSNDVETNPGDFVNNFFSFCNWNLNSLAKDNFYRVKLLEAHNSFQNYDFISICETS